MPTHKSRTRRATSKKGQESSKKPITNPEHVRILFSLAKALNAADKAKLHPVLTLDSVFTNVGYVIPVGRKSRWQVRIPLKKARDD